jgi:rRNA maturation endonuclease Nob1
MKDYPSMTIEDKKWHAECDARTLMEAEEIRKDESRHTAAQLAAEKLQKEKESEAESLKAVAQGKVSYSSMPKEVQ